MTPEIVKLRIRAEKIGTVREVKELLTDFENAYNRQDLQSRKSRKINKM